MLYIAVRVIFFNSSCRFCVDYWDVPTGFGLVVWGSPVVWEHLEVCHLAAGLKSAAIVHMNALPERRTYVCTYNVYVVACMSIIVVMWRCRNRFVSSDILWIACVRSAELVSLRSLLA